VLNKVKVTMVAGFSYYPTRNVPRHLRRKALSVENMGGLKVIRRYVPPLPARGLAARTNSAH
jgi:hypothetical protein